MTRYPTLSVRIQHWILDLPCGPDTLRWRDMNGFQRAWHRAWNAIFKFFGYHIWRRGLYPHLRPRTWLKDEYSWMRVMALPEHITVYVNESEHGGYTCDVWETGVQFLTVAGAWTREQAIEDAESYLDFCRDFAGYRYPADGGVVVYVDGEPPAVTS